MNLLEKKDETSLEEMISQMAVLWMSSKKTEVIGNN
jgi:hypothetical protein